MTTQIHNHSHADHSDGIDAAGTHRAFGDTMAARLPETARVLRVSGVVRVVATYGSGLCAMAFVNKEADAIQPPCSPAMTREILQVFESLVAKRLPPRQTYNEMRGSFEWNVVNDTIRHEHTSIHLGL